MNKCEEPFFGDYEECMQCEAETTGRCVLEKAFMQQIIDKLNDDERLFITWMLLKARGAGELNVQEFTEAFASAFEKVGAAE